MYDYFRCPKIVAIKAYRHLHPPERKREAPARAEPEVSASVVGKLGEAAVAAAFSPEALAAETIAKLRETGTQQTASTVSSMGVVIDENARRILAETVNGLA